MHNFIFAHMKYYELSQTNRNKLLKFFIENDLKLIDSISSPDQKTWTISFLGVRDSVLEKLIQFNLQNHSITRKHLYSIVFNPLRLKDLLAIHQFLQDNLHRLQNSLQRPFFLSGYLKSAEQPVYFKWTPPAEVFSNQISRELPSDFFLPGKYESSVPLFIALCPYPITIFIKVAIESAEVLNVLEKKIQKFLQKRTPERVDIPLIQYSYVANEAMTIGKIALKIIDYKLLPVHNAMIYLYDTFEKINIVPVEAEFGQPVPMDIIQTAIDDLFSNLDAGITPSTEMIKTLNLFRFNIEEIFEYPSYIIEKRFDLI